MNNSNNLGGARVQGGTQKLNIAEIMSPITNAHIQAPTSKKSRSGAHGGNYNNNGVSATHRNTSSQLSQSKRPQQMGRNSRTKLSKQGHYNTSNNNGQGSHTAQ